MTLQGVFKEVVPHERMVHTETMRLGSGETVGSLLETHEFEEKKGGVTTMRITQAYDSKEPVTARSLPAWTRDGSRVQAADAMLAQPA
jgi:hypothetical protein